MKKIITISFILFSTLLSAQNWRGTVSSDWNNAANWSATPTNGSAKTIDPANYTGAALHPVINANSTFTSSTITILNGGELVVNANVSTTGNFVVNDAGSLLTVNSGVLQVGNRLIIDLGANMLINAGNVNVNQRFITGEGSTTTMQNGTVNAGQRLLLDVGGIFNFNAGNITVGQTMALADGSAANSCQFNMNGGVLIVNGVLSLDNEFGAFEPTFTMNAGTLNLNGDLLWLGTAPGTGTPRVLLNGGTATISGLIQNTALSTVNMYLKLDGNAVLNYSGSLIENLYATDSIIQRGNAGLFISGNNTITNAGVFLADSVITYVNGNTALQGGGSYQFSTLHIQNAGNVNHQNPLTISVSGDFITNGNFVANNNTVYFNGTTTQSVIGVASPVFNNLTIDNSSATGININVNTTITGHLELTNGKLNTATSHLITLNDNATAGSGNPFSFVNGPMVKTGDDAFVFPTGKDNKWRNISINAPLLAGASYKAEYFNNSPAVISPVNLPLTAVSNIEYWQLESLGSASPVSVELYWEDAAMSAISNCSALTIANFNGTSWDTIPSTASGNCTGNGSGSIVSDTIVSSYGMFTFGYLSGVTTQNISFCNGDSVMIGTNTYATTGIYMDTLQDVLNNDSLVVTGLTVFTINASVTLSGMTLEAVDSTADAYQWVDCANAYAFIPAEINRFFTPTSGGSYAAIVTKNGCSDTSLCTLFTSVGWKESKEGDKVKVFPNPTDGNMNIYLGNITNAEITIFDSRGRVIKEEMIKNEKEVKYSLDLISGIYLIRITDVDSNTIHLQKVIKE